MNSQFSANMPSTDGDTDVTEGLGRDQNLNNIEKQESPRRGSVATPVKSSIFSNSQAKINTKDLFASIEIDDSYDPVTPSDSSAKAVRGNGRKTVRSLSPRKAASTKRTPNQISKINQSSKKREIRESRAILRSELRGEYSEEDDDDWEDENDGVKSPENTWGKAGKVIGSAGKPTHPNGRVEGRKLVPWHKVRMPEKLILCMVYECRRAELDIPWDNIAHRIRPGSSGAATIQHINKLREILIPEGHLVPPPFAKKNNVDPNVRGYIRDMNSEDPKATRAVTWDEKIEDLKESLVIPGVTRGSGTYRRDRARWQNNKVAIVEETPTKTLSSRQGAEKRAPKAKTEQKEKSFMVKRERSESIDPTEMPSDEDYDPGNRLKIKGHRKRKVKVKTERKYDLDETSDSEGESFGYSDNDDFLEETPCKKVAGNHAMTPLASLPLKLKISPDKLKKFAAGASVNSAEEEVAVDETEYIGRYGDGDDDAETIADAHARDVDDVFGHVGLHLNNGNSELQNQLVFTPYGYNGGMNPGSGTYNPQGALNAQSYDQVYGQTYSSHNFMNVETGPYQNTHGSYQYPNQQFFGFQTSGSAPVINHGLNFDGPGEMMQDLNGGHNSMSSLPPSIGVSSDSSGYGNFTDSAGPTYDGSAYEFIDPSELPGQGFESFNDGFVQDYNSNQPFIPDDSNL
ncbi:putative heat shock protein mitochondrial precursor protein [Botrytis fragariae]|uniref:Putative heat shock protein mitochondrial protein n=1 Tax=Botrytis fragariae TaxID=1964551 RepID=A0A8H6AUX0_9HELO|nr:putative heat shock protein mitochondrial precursor protein [Botrytis fragariae]KAF5874253.1 putative heat shock protein mitochondrial precursor protein [Botrytis fragariae]